MLVTQANSAFDTKMILYSHANKTHFHKKSCALDLMLKLRVSGTRKWPIASYRCEAFVKASILEPDYWDYVHIRKVSYMMLK